MRAFTLSVAFLLALTGCSHFRAQNARLGDLDLKQRAGSTDPCPDHGSDALRLYYDRDGALYPQSVLDTPLRDRSFSASDTSRLIRTYLDGDGREYDPWPAVRTELGLASDAPRDESEWRAIQGELVARAGRRIRERTLSGATPRTLVVLVHGFNNAGCEADGGYARIKQRLAEEGMAHAETAVYLQVYWDGLRQTIGLPIWGSAQYNFPLVGLEFRRVLATVPNEVPIRIVTHSSGGPLVASALWDAGGSLRRLADPQYTHYFQNIAGATPDYPLPTHPDIRVGMIVPAMPSSAFPRDGAGRFLPGRVSADRVVIGVNRRDLVIGKFGLGCKQGGHTCLSRGPEDYCGTIWPQSRPADPTVRLVDIARTDRVVDGLREPLSFHNHGVESYLLYGGVDRLLRMVFADDADPGDGPALCP